MLIFETDVSPEQFQASFSMTPAMVSTRHRQHDRFRHLTSFTQADARLFLDSAGIISFQCQSVSDNVRENKNLRSGDVLTHQQLLDRFPLAGDGTDTDTSELCKHLRFLCFRSSKL